MSEVAAQSTSKAADNSARTETIERYFAAIAAGDSAALDEVLAPDAVTRWPQSGERIVGAGSCINVYENLSSRPSITSMIDGMS